MLNLKQTKLVNTIKLLIYKENPSLLEKIDFDDNTFFLEPLLFTYFNYKKDNSLSGELLIELVQSHFLKKQRVQINHCLNTNGIAYIPKLGYFKKGESIPFEQIHIIKNTNIEILKYPGELLYNLFRNDSGDLISPNEIEFNLILSKKNIHYLTNALKLMKTYSNEHFNLIEQCCKRILLFKTDINNTNSFAAIKAHGIAFLNVYQDDYEDVFFIDDIAHQTGHIILTTLFYDRKSIFKIDEEQNVQDILKIEDHRTIYILIHALYTYYTTFMYLDDCLQNNAFNENQKKEAIGRIGFYLLKCSFDLTRFNQITIHHHGIENVLTSKGTKIYKLIRKKHNEIHRKWYKITQNLDYNEQPYNFTFKIFDRLNTIDITKL